MNDWAKRFALAALVGLLTSLFATPVACSGFVLYNEHRFGDVESAGPLALLAGMAVAGALGLAVAVLVWRASRPR